MKKLLLLFVLFALWACSDDKVSGISTVETENAFLIRVVRGDSLPAANVVARVRTVDFVRDSANESEVPEFFVEYVADSLGRIHIDSLAVEVASIEIVSEGEGVFRRLFARDVREGDSVQFVLEKTGSLHGKVYLPEGVDYAWVQVYGTDRLVKTDSNGFYEMDSLPPFEYIMRIVVGDSVVKNSAKVDAGEESLANVYAFEPDSVKVLDFESDNEKFFINDLGISVTGYMAVTDTSVRTTPSIDENFASFLVDAGAGREGKALHWESSAGFGFWSFFGTWVCKEKSPCNLSAMDSVVFYARGTGIYSIIFESLGKSNLEGKTLANDTLKSSDEWKRVCIKPSDFKPRDDLYGNFGWDAVSEAVTTITVAAYDSTEVWIDDITLYGVKPSDFATK
jgi:hypothetical protein